MRVGSIDLTPRSPTYQEAGLALPTVVNIVLSSVATQYAGLSRSSRELENPPYSESDSVNGTPRIKVCLRRDSIKYWQVPELYIVPKGSRSLWLINQVSLQICWQGMNHETS